MLYCIDCIDDLWLHAFGCEFGIVDRRHCLSCLIVFAAPPSNLHTYTNDFDHLKILILSSFYSHQFEMSCSFPPALSFSLSLQTNSTPFPIFHFDISWGEPLKRQFQCIKQLMSFGVSYVLLTAWCLRRVLQCSFLLFLLVFYYY